MYLQVAKWGNSLALRLPAEYARRTGIKAGDRVEACLTPDGGLTIRPAIWNRKAFAKELETAREAMKPGRSVIEELRRVDSTDDGACRHRHTGRTVPSCRATRHQGQGHGDAG